MGFTISSDYFTFKTENIRVAYILENVLASYETLPLAFFGESSFGNVQYEDELIKIGIMEWIPFYNKFYKLFSGDNDTNIVFRIYLKQFIGQYSDAVEKLADSYAEKNIIIRSDLIEAFKLYSIVQGYAICNFLMPQNMLTDIIQQHKDIKSFDEFACSLVESHRVQRRKKELELCLKAIDGNINTSDICEYRANQFIYAMEDKWNFYNKVMDSEQYIIKIINKMSKKMTKEEILDELIDLAEKRKNKLRRLHRLLAELWHSRNASVINEQIYNIAILIVNITTQEEIRHMATSKFMYILGKMAYERDLDLGTSSTAQIIKYLPLRVE